MAHARSLYRIALGSARGPLHAPAACPGPCVRRVRGGPAPLRGTRICLTGLSLGYAVQAPSRPADVAGGVRREAGTRHSERGGPPRIERVGESSGAHRGVESSGAHRGVEASAGCTKREGGQRSSRLLVSSALVALLLFGTGCSERADCYPGCLDSCEEALTLCNAACEGRTGLFLQNCQVRCNAADDQCGFDCDYSLYPPDCRGVW